MSIKSRRGAVQHGDPVEHDEKEIEQDGKKPEDEKPSGFSISPVAYKVGDQVLLEDDRAFQILDIADGKITVSDADMPLLVRFMEQRDFEAILRGKAVVLEIVQEGIALEQPREVTHTAEDENSSNAPTKEKASRKARPPMDAAHVNYRKMQSLFPAIMDGSTTYIRYEAGEAFDPLLVSNDADGIIAIAHTYEQNGDAMYDPRMELRVDHEAKTIEAATFENSGLGLYQNVYPQEGKYIPALRKDLNRFLKQWLKNIEEQGYEPKKIMPIHDGQEVVTEDFSGGIPILPPPENKSDTAGTIVPFPMIAKVSQFTAPPYVRILWSEHPIFEDGERLSVAEAEYLFAELDSLTIKSKQEAVERGEDVKWSYFKTRFKLVLEADGKKDALETRYSFGDGCRGLIDFFKSNAEAMLNNPYYREGLSSEEINAQEAIRDGFVPYLRQFTKLEPEARMKLNARLGEYRSEEAKRTLLGLDKPNVSDQFIEISEQEFEREIIEDLNEAKKPVQEKSYELGFGFLGNGMTVWNRLEEVGGDYKTVAHIDNDGGVDFYEDIPKTLQGRINEEAQKHRDEQEFQKHTLTQDELAEYALLKNQYPNALIGFQIGKFYAFYDEDAQKASKILESKIIFQEAEGQLAAKSVTGFHVETWASKSKKLWAVGNDVVLYGYNGSEAERSLMKHLKADEYIPIGMKLNIEGKEHIVESVDFTHDDVSLEDISHENRNIYSSYQHKKIEVVRAYVEEQQWESPNNLNQEPQPDQEENQITFDEAQQNAELKNYRITDEHYGEAGAKTRFQKNMDAIWMLNEIETEGLEVTDRVQDILAGYTGWGAIPQAFDEKNEKWSKEYLELKDALSDEEYRAARASVLNAHYTTPVVIQAVYQVLENMGLKQGKMCDPACGIGNFYGAAPKSLDAVKFYGVEIDNLTAQIAKYLYPEVKIQQCGFEKTNFDDNFFDVMVGNVPFGEYKVADQRYDKYNFLIHDYFFARSLDKVRPGGVVAMLTSKGTMDKGNPTTRKYLAQRAELLGAIRLPNNTFKANAGTEVTIDIIFLQKRERPLDIEPDKVNFATGEREGALGHWVHLSQTEDGVPVNSYFAEHPEMILGKMEFWANMYGKETDTACLPIKGANLADQLAAAVENIRGEIIPDTQKIKKLEPTATTIPADPKVKNYCFTLHEGEIYYRENAEMHLMDFADITKGRVKGLCEIRAVVRELIDAQMNNASDEEIKDGQKRLNALYDSFVKKNGIINSRGNSLAFRSDTDYPLLCSLEVLDDEDKFVEKAAFFSKRTIRPPRIIATADTAHEALIASIAERGRVYLSYMCTLYGKDEEQVLNELEGYIYFDPKSETWVTKEEYLSGNVRSKLQEAQKAAEADRQYALNVKALEEVQPKDIPAEEIDVKIGSVWIPEEDYKQFIVEILEPSEYTSSILHIEYSKYTGGWAIHGAPSYGSIAAKETYGTNRKDAYEIMETALNLRLIEVRDRVEVDGKERYVLNTDDTIAAQAKQAELQEKFREWIFEDESRRERLVRKYNDEMNNIVPREYDGSHIIYHGMNPEIELRDYQRNADARILYGGNTLLGHVVGSGKTFEIVAAIQESKYLGLCSKAMIVVPNHLLMQWASDYLRLYPGANILVVSAKDFEKERRRKFCARIATGEYDAVIIGHSQLQKIPMSKEWEEEYVNEQIDEIMEGIAEAKEREDAHWSIKQMEGMRKNLEERLKQLNSGVRDNVLDFEELGIDMLVVDESQEFKNRVKRCA